MPTTRSHAKQLKLEDVAEVQESGGRQKSTSKSSAANKVAQDKSSTGSASKRKRAAQKDATPSGKRSKSTPTQSEQPSNVPTDDAEETEKPIMINRAPVLQLWSACVANFLRPDLSWTACLNIGNAISSLCAISKGKAIGKIEPKDQGNEEQQTRKEESKQAKQGTDEVEVMGFLLHLKDDAVILSGTTKSLNEANLINKFGEEHAYTTTKRVMIDSLQGWTDRKDDLDSKAFHMYERFRPNVAKGSQGWGRKGELDLDEIERSIKP